MTSRRARAGNRAEQIERQVWERLGYQVFDLAPNFPCDLLCLLVVGSRGAVPLYRITWVEVKSLRRGNGKPKPAQQEFLRWRHELGDECYLTTYRRTPGTPDTYTLLSRLRWGDRVA